MAGFNCEVGIEPVNVRGLRLQSDCTNQSDKQ